MIENIIGIAIIAIISSTLSLMLKKERPEISFLLSLCGGIVILYMIFPAARSAAEIIKTVSDLAGINSQYISVILKSCIIAMITGVCASTCRDSGNSSLAVKLEIAGRITIIILAFPIINTLFNVILSVIN